MDESKLSSFAAVPIEEFLSNYAYGKELAAGKTSEIRDFRSKCRSFLDHLVVVLLRNMAVTSKLSQGLYSFCPEIMLEGDDHTVFGLFASLCNLLKSCGVLKADESAAAVEEYHSYIIEKRRQHAGEEHAASDIPDVIRYLIRDFSFQARVHLFRVFKLCCLVIGVPEAVPPVVTLDLSGCAFSTAIVRDCLLLVQSYVLSWGYAHKTFFVDRTLDVVREAIANAGAFYVAADFDLWRDICGEDLDAFITPYRSLYRDFILERRKSCESYYIGLNKANLEARSRQGSVVSDTGSTSSSTVKSKKVLEIRGQGTSVGTVAGGSTSKKSVVSADVAVIKKGGSESASKKSKGSKTKANEDPEVRHRIKKL